MTPLPRTAVIDDRLQKRLAAGLALLAVVVRLGIAWRTHSTGEDALITLRYAENIASGRGFVYNPGARVLGSTTPLYTLLLALFGALRLDALGLGKGLNILADGGTCYLLARLLGSRTIGRPIAGLFAALLYALTSTAISISIGGMETGLVTFVGLAMIREYVAGRAARLYPLGGLLYLLRIDGLLLFAILAIGLAVRKRTVPWRPAASALAIALPWTLFAVFYFGSPIPTSLLAKVTAYSHGGRVGLSSLHPRSANREAFHAQFGGGIVQKMVSLLATAGILVVAAAVCRRRPRSTPIEPARTDPSALLAIPAAWMLLYFAAMLTSRVPAFPWYFLPPWPVVMALAALGAHSLVAIAEIGARKLAGRFAARFSGSGRAAGVPPNVPAAGTERNERPAARFTGPHRGAGPSVRSLCGLLAAGCLAGALHLPAITGEIALRQRQDDAFRREIGIWLRAHSLPGERVLLEPIGYIGYYSRLPIVDSIGLVSPEVLPSYRTENPLADMTKRLQPEWLCLRPAEADQLTPAGDTLLGGDYTLRKTFRGPDTPTVFRVYRRRSDTVPAAGR